MSTSGRDPRRQGEGDYPDRDMPAGDVEPTPEGSYTDQETPREARGEDPDLRGPEDDGEYTDRDVVQEHRAPPAPGGGYTSKDSGTSGDAPTNDAGEHGHG